jgi:mRNA interferase MazF
MSRKHKKAKKKGHTNKYHSYSKAEKIMQQQINEELKNYETVITEEPKAVEEVQETTCNLRDYEEEMAYYKDVEPYKGEIRRGEIYFFDKGPVVGVEQQGGRPGIIVSNNLCNKHSEFVEVVYTTCQPKTDMLTHVVINSTPKPCTALCEQIHTLSKKKIRCYYGEITAEEECEINKALAVNLSLPQETKCDNNSKENIELLKLQLDAALEANEEYDKAVQQMTQEIVELTKRINITPSTEGGIYKNLYHDLLDKILKIKLQEEK